jgi:hypothetical protein
MNEAPDLLFHVGFGSLEDAGGEIYDGFPTFMSITFLPALPIFSLAAGFCGADQGCSIQPGLIDIKDEDAVIAERDFFGLPGVVRVLPVKAGLIAIDGMSL